MNDYLPVTAVEVDGPVTKTPKHLVYGYNQFSVPVLYTLADGRKIHGHIGGSLKRDVLPNVERQNVKAQRGDVSLKVSDDNPTRALIVQMKYSLASSGKPDGSSVLV